MLFYVLILSLEVSINNRNLRLNMRDNKKCSCYDSCYNNMGIFVLINVVFGVFLWDEFG